jgi:hypothetical protein
MARVNPVKLLENVRERTYGNPRGMYARLVRLGYQPEHALNLLGIPFRSAEGKLLRHASDKCLDTWAMEVEVDPKELMELAQTQAVWTLVFGMHDRDPNGNITNRAIRCCENILDRLGHGRINTIKHEEIDSPEKSRDRQDLISVVREKLELLQAPVSKPPALLTKFERETIEAPIEIEEEPEEAEDGGVEYDKTTLGY